MVRILKQTDTGISFIELLLDETLCQGDILVSRELVCQVGGINKKLKAKQKYELILRIAQEKQISFEETDSCDVRDGAGVSGDDDVMVLHDDMESKLGWQTDCYVTGKYSSQLRGNGCFELVIESLLNEAVKEGRYHETVEYLEQMIGRAGLFYDIDDAVRPILIYKGDDVCHNVLTVFAEKFGKALEDSGQSVIYFDVAQESLEHVMRYVGQRFKAIVGFQTYMYKIKMKDGIHDLHEQIYGPKYNFIFDHPVWAKTYLVHQFPDFHVLTHDENYVAFIQKYYQKHAILFPPAGIATKSDGADVREYDLSFVGACGDYRSELLLIHKMERKKRFLANAFLLKMKKKPWITAEQALAEVLAERDYVYTEQLFFELLYELRRVIYCVVHYYRVKVLRSIVESGIRVNVFGDSWMQSELKEYPNLICHGDVTIEESLKIWQKSKLSLNIMSWHKGGFTERMANIMLSGAVLVTDSTSYLKKQYNHEDMIIFELNKLEHLPQQLKEIIHNEQKRLAMAERGREKTRREHTWNKRAEQFLGLLQ